MSAPMFDHLMGPLNQLLRSHIKNTAADMRANLWHPNLLSHHLKLCDGPFRLAVVHNWVLSPALVHYLCQIIPPFPFPVCFFLPFLHCSIITCHTPLFFLHLHQFHWLSTSLFLAHFPLSMFSFSASWFPAVISSALLPSFSFFPLPLSLSRLHCVSKRVEVVKHFSSLLIVLTCAIGIPIRAHWFPSAKCIDFYISYWSRF